MLSIDTDCSFPLVVLRRQDFFQLQANAASHFDGRFIFRGNERDDVGKTKELRVGFLDGAGRFGGVALAPEPPVKQIPYFLVGFGPEFLVQETALADEFPGSTQADRPKAMPVPRVTGDAALNPFPGFRNAFQGGIMAHRHRITENHLEIADILQVELPETETFRVGRQQCHGINGIAEVNKVYAMESTFVNQEKPFTWQSVQPPRDLDYGGLSITSISRPRSGGLTVSLVTLPFSTWPSTVVCLGACNLKSAVQSRGHAGKSRRRWPTH